MKSLRGKLTYANIMATIAVFIALGGASYAATHLPKNSVGTRQLKKGAVTTAKIAKGTQAALAGSKGPKGVPGPPGTPGAPGAPATRLFAQVNSDGTVNASGSPVTAKRLSSGRYIVNFGREIGHCAVSVNQASVPDFGGAGTAHPSTVGYAPQVTNFSANPPEEELQLGFPLTKSVYVTTFNGSAEGDSSFYIAVLC